MKPKNPNTLHGQPRLDNVLKTSKTMGDALRRLDNLSVEQLASKVPNLEPATLERFLNTGNRSGLWWHQEKAVAEVLRADWWELAQPPSQRAIDRLAKKVS
jgi:hypothetical protein